jgi:hypothetical protein
MGVSGQRHPILIGKIQRPLLSQFLSASLLGGLLQPEQRILVEESVMIITQIGSTIDQKMVAFAWDAFYDNTL